MNSGPSRGTPIFPVAAANRNTYPESMKTVVSDRGQITLPKGIRDDLGIKAGTILDFEVVDGAIVGRKRKEVDSIQAWRGRGRLPEGMKSVDEYLERTRE